MIESLLNLDDSLFFSYFVFFFVIKVQNSYGLFKILMTLGEMGRNFINRLNVKLFTCFCVAKPHFKCEDIKIYEL